MDGIGRQVWWALVILLLIPVMTSAQEDRNGCKDHPLFTRMENFYLSFCREREFDRVDFRDENGKEVKVEGRYSYSEYSLKKGFAVPSGLQIIKNFENAVKKIGGVKIYEKGGNDIWLKLDLEGKIFYVYVRAPHGSTYYLTVVEKAGMKQEVTADAKSLMNDIQAKGHASVYGIHFDFDKADIKPESEPTIREVAKLLQENKGLRLYVVGHTDNAGTLDYNLKLSKARADAVVKELITKYRIAADRLKAFGVASLAPVASNKTDDERAKNRRVELVEQ
ncbi:MAG: OmpA family protein [Nitrospira sp.]|nr:OmpA family protein [Nitrospira sp.]